MIHHATSTPISPFFPPTTGIIDPPIRSVIPTTSADERVYDWLSGIGIDRQSIDSIMREEYTLEDLWFYVDRGDIRRINLR